MWFKINRATNSFRNIATQDAEGAGYAAEEVSAALPLCGDKGPLEWLTDNWSVLVGDKGPKKIGL